MFICDISKLFIKDKMQILLTKFLNLHFQRNIYWIYILYILVLILLTFLYSIAILDIHPIYIDENSNINIKNLGRSNNKIIENLIANNEFKFNYLGIDFYTAKYPLLPYTIFFISKISKNFYFVLIFKNIIFYSILFWSVFYYVLINIKKNKLLIFIVIIILLHFNPYNFHVMSNFYFEDFANAIILPALFLLILTKSNSYFKFFVIGVLISLLFLSKGSFTVFGYLFPLIFIFLNKKNFYSYVPLILFLITSNIWSLHSYNKTGYYAFFNKNSSFNQRELAIPLQENFYKFYPFYSVDVIHNTKQIFKDRKKYGFDNIDNEWEFNELYKIRNVEYIKENYLRFIKDIFIKINFIFFYPYQDGNTGSADINKKEIKYMMIINKFFLLLGIILATKNIYNKYNSKKKFNEELQYFLILSLIIPIHLISWATSKHLIGICSVSIIYLVNSYIESKKNF